jgi:flagellar biosynthesis protein FlhB
MPALMQIAINLVLLFVVVMAILGAVDYIVESVAIFTRTLRRYRERNRDED